jgi:hypothetical protein
MDITYIPMARGFVYLAAVVDWFSRRVLSWRLTITLETEFCLDAVNEALARHGKAESFNTDQGSQFSSVAFTGLLQEHKIAISMDGRGAWRDNVFVACDGEADAGGPPLAQQELQLVWPADTGNHGDQWMLLGKSPTNGFVGNGRLIKRLFETTKTANWTWHDLRRTARTGMTYLGVPEAAAEAALNHITGKSKLVAIYDHSGPSTSGIAALRTWQGYVTDVVEGRRKPGDAENSYRESLPEDLRWRSRPKFVPRTKAKPGRGASRRVEAEISVDCVTTPRTRKRGRKTLNDRTKTG